MNDRLNTLLRAADPLSREAGLSAIEAQTMRQKIVLAAVETRPGWLPGSFAVAASVAGALLVGVMAGGRGAPGPAERPQPVAAVHERRQLQFETPGGTRVVWVLNPTLDFPKDRQQ